MLYILSVKNSITIKSDKLQIQLYFLPVNNFKLLYKRNSLFENFFPSFLRKEILFFVFFYILKKRLFFIYCTMYMFSTFLRKKKKEKAMKVLMVIICTSLVVTTITSIILQLLLYISLWSMGNLLW